MLALHAQRLARDTLCRQLSPHRQKEPCLGHTQRTQSINSSAGIQEAFYQNLVCELCAGYLRFEDEWMSAEKRVFCSNFLRIGTIILSWKEERDVLD